MKTLNLLLGIMLLGLSSFGQGEYTKKKKIFQDDLYAQPFEQTQKEVTKTKMLKGNSSYYFKKASTNLTIGFTAGIGGCILSATSGYLTKDVQTMKTISYVGAGIGVFGLVELIIGSTQIGKAGICLDKERKIYISPSKNGIGANIRF